MHRISRDANLRFDVMMPAMEGADGASMRSPACRYTLPSGTCGADMATYSLTVNGRNRNVAVDGSTPLLWVLRDHLGLTGTKFGCGAGFCGACTVHVGGQPLRSCSVPISAVADAVVTTI